MISICIPVYNFNIAGLVADLCREAKEINVSYEIVVIDDGSSQAYTRMNEQACKEVKYIALDKNIGRARIRNLFLKHTKFDNLLFLDCDSKIISKDFISKYIASIKQYEYNIIYGGRVYNKTAPERKKMLNWKYGVRRESQTLNLRLASPNKSFTTNNFLVHRKVLEEVPFDERITGHGHEDTLFGFELGKRGIKISHIDNPVLNGNMEDNIVFLKKTEQSVINLIHILNYVHNDSEFVQDVNILRVYKKIDSRHLTGIIKFSFILCKPFLKFILSKGIVSLKLFDFYKLGVLIQNYRRYTLNQ